MATERKLSANEKLQQIGFDGLPSVPCRSVGLDWTHSLPVRSYPYVDGDGHDHTGRRSATMDVELLFWNTLVLEQPGIVLFPTVFNQWLERLLSGRSGNLEHPIFGNRRARVAHGSVPLVSEVRDGVTVDVTFIETLDEPEQQIPFKGPDVSAEAAAIAAQAACNTAGIAYPDGTPDEPDLLTATRAAIANAESRITRAEGKINQLQGKIVRMLDDAERLNNHAMYAAQDNLTTLWVTLNDLKNRLPATVQRAIGEAVTQAPNTSLTTLATRHGNTVEEMMGLNPLLLREPTIPRGTRYKYFVGNNVSVSLNTSRF
jgi:prophage DNA circulation protein